MYEHSLSTINTQTLRRMPYYIQQLKELQKENVTSVSAPKIAERLKLNEVQVRKDFAAISSTKGKPKRGFTITELLYNMEELLGYHNADEAVLVGTGPLAHAILTHEGIRSYGLRIVAVFHAVANSIDCDMNGVKVLPCDKIINLCRRMNIHIGIITTPPEQAQEICDQLVSGGVLAIWNFSEMHLSVPEHILVHDENFTASLAILSKHLKKRGQGKQETQ